MLTTCFIHNSNAYQTKKKSIKFHFSMDDFIPFSLWCLCSQFLFVYSKWKSVHLCVCVHRLAIPIQYFWFTRFRRLYKTSDKHQCFVMKRPAILQLLSVELKPKITTVNGNRYNNKTLISNIVHITELVIEQRKIHRH